MVRRRIGKKRVLEILSRFSNSKVLVVGDVMVDHFIWGKVSRISPEAPVPVIEVARESLMLGGSANVMNNVIASGGKVFATGVIGDDEMGRWLIQECRRRGIGTEGLVSEPGRPTTVKTRIVAHSQQMVRFDRERRTPILKDSVDQILGYIESVLGDLHAVVISDYNKGMITEALLEGIREILAEKGVPVCVDPKQNDLSIYRGFDVITPNHHEAARAAGLDRIDDDRGAGKARPLEIGKRLLEKYGFKAVLITRGEEGMDLFEKGSVLHIPTVAKEVYDVTGAGDTVIGIFALAAASGATFKEAAYIANRAAGIVVGKVGTATVSREELKKIL